MIRFAGLCALALGAAGPALAFCDAMEQVAIEGGSLALPGGDDTVECTTSLQLSGGTQVQCGWPFAYRAETALAAFARLNDTVAVCLGPDAVVTQDQSVNHPDFYDLRIYQTTGRDIGVSLKDKAALQQTYVFLRLSARNEG